MKKVMEKISTRMLTGDIRNNDPAVILMASYKLLLEMQETQEQVLEQLKKKKN
jgi:hypothetical protein